MELLCDIPALSTLNDYDCCLMDGGRQRGWWGRGPEQSHRRVNRSLGGSDPRPLWMGSELRSR